MVSGLKGTRGSRFVRTSCPAFRVNHFWRRVRGSLLGKGCKPSSSIGGQFRVAILQESFHQPRPMHGRPTAILKPNLFWSRLSCRQDVRGASAHGDLCATTDILSLCR